MSEKPLPKTLQNLTAKSPEKFDEGHSDEQGHWIYLKPGWHASEKGRHIIQAETTKAAAKAFRASKPCDCEDCVKAQDARRTSHKKPATKGQKAA